MRKPPAHSSDKCADGHGDNLPSKTTGHAERLEGTKGLAVDVGRPMTVMSPGSALPMLSFAPANGLTPLLEGMNVSPMIVDVKKKGGTGRSVLEASPCPGMLTPFENRSPWFISEANSELPNVMDSPPLSLPSSSLSAIPTSPTLCLPPKVGQTANVAPASSGNRAVQMRKGGAKPAHQMTLSDWLAVYDENVAAFRRKNSDSSKKMIEGKRRPKNLCQSSEKPSSRGDTASSKKLKLEPATSATVSSVSRRENSRGERPKMQSGRRVAALAGSASDNRSEAIKNDKISSANHAVRRHQRRQVVHRNASLRYEPQNRQHKPRMPTRSVSDPMPQTTSTYDDEENGDSPKSTTIMDFMRNSPPRLQSGEGMASQNLREDQGARGADGDRIHQSRIHERSKGLFGLQAVTPPSRPTAIDFLVSTEANHIVPYDRPVQSQNIQNKPQDCSRIPWRHPKSRRDIPSQQQQLCTEQERLFLADVSRKLRERREEFLRQQRKRQSAKKEPKENKKSGNETAESHEKKKTDGDTTLSARVVDGQPVKALVLEEISPITEKTEGLLVLIQNLQRQIRCSPNDTLLPERRYMCSFCKKSSTQRSNAVSHIRIHTGERPFKCAECGKGFKQKSNMKRHHHICLIRHRQRTPCVREARIPRSVKRRLAEAEADVLGTIPTRNYTRRRFSSSPAHSTFKRHRSGPRPEISSGGLRGRGVGVRAAGRAGGGEQGGGGAIGGGKLYRYYFPTAGGGRGRPQ